MQEAHETQVWSLGWEDTLEEEMVIHSRILAGTIPWTEEPGGLQYMGSQRVGHDWSYLACMHMLIWWWEEMEIFLGSKTWTHASIAIQRSSSERHKPRTKITPHRRTQHRHTSQQDHGDKDPLRTQVLKLLSTDYNVSALSMSHRK